MLSTAQAAQSNTTLFRSGISGYAHVPCHDNELMSIIQRSSNNAESLITKYADSEDPALEPIKPLGFMSILLAEDNTVNQRVAVAMLEHFGASVTVAENGQEVLSSYQQDKFDVILMDVQMPVLDGISATKELRKQYPDHQVPIIALTANAMNGDREMCLEAGMTDYCAKPLRKQELLEALLRTQ